jgi:type II secretory pathway component PulK
MDDLAELLLVRGVTPEVYWGPRAAHHRLQLFNPNANALAGIPMPSYPVGVVELFTALSNGRININTASAQVLRLLPGVDENIAANIIRARAGPDGAEGTEDDTPFVNLGGLNPAMVPGIIPEMTARYAMLCGVTSSTFEVQVEVRLGRHHRTYTAIVRRNRPDDVPILQFGWR